MENGSICVKEDQSLFKTPRKTGMHGYCLPNACYGRGTEMAVFLARGKGIKRGYRKEYYAPIVNVAPTIAEVLGISPPSTAEGSVIRDIFTED
jgi:hypothetical protein